MQLRSMSGETSADLGLKTDASRMLLWAIRCVGAGWEGSWRRDGSPGSQEPHRRSPGGVDLSARAVRRGAAPTHALSPAVRPRGLLSRFPDLPAGRRRREARVPGRREVSALRRAIHLGRESARRSLDLPHHAAPLALALLRPRHRASGVRTLVLSGAGLRARSPRRAVPHGRPHRDEGVRAVPAQSRRSRGARAPHLLVAHGLSASSNRSYSRYTAGSNATNSTLDGRVALSSARVISPSAMRHAAGIGKP